MKTILAIETSCDETAIALVRGKGKAKPLIFVCADVVSSQIKIHKKYGGVVPHLAAREHEKNLPIVLRETLQEAGRQCNIKRADIDMIAVTKGPGLSPALWRGITFAHDLAGKWEKPILGVDHMEGHLAANFVADKVSRIPNIKFPILCLTVSGGHTQLVLMRDWLKYKLLGETVDDAAGEAFDKVARMLNLPYPGGPPIAKQASLWKSQFQNSKSQTKSKNKKYPLKIKLPRPMIYTKNYNFSFSGLKTAVLYDYKKRSSTARKSKAYVQQMSAEFQQAVVDVLVAKTIKAAHE